VDVPTAVRDELLRFLPREDRLPARLEQGPETTPLPPDTPLPPGTAPPPLAPGAAVTDELRRAVWELIWTAPALPSGVRIGEATSAVTPWPHQVRAFHRMWDHWPPKLLIADEVGLGKTIEAGMVLRQAWLSGRAKRILVLAPKAVLTQWQRELREKFNLDWPIYDGDTLAWQPTPVHADGVVRTVARDEWQHEPFVLASSQLLRRRERQPELVAESVPPWDLVVLDEAHHARRRNPGQPAEGGPNLLLRLMQGLRRKTQGMILLTATPMQVHPLEVFDLLALLDLPPQWTTQSFLEFFRLAVRPNPAHADFELLAALFRAVERHLGPVDSEDATRRAPQASALRGKRILRALRDSSPIPRRQLDAEDRRAAVALVRAHTPVSRLISRHTRDLLREYHRLGRLATPIATRRVEDRFLALSEAEAAVYAAVEDYIATTYNNAAQDERSSVGFVMTIYRRRLASSFFALRRTLEDRLAAMRGESGTLLRPDRLDEDAEAAEDEGEADADDALAMERRALDSEERGDIERLLAMVATLPPDTKARRLRDELAALRERGYAQAIVFTQYTDTLDYLRDWLRESGLRILCFSGRGGEFLQRDGNWRAITREETKRRFRAGDADVLLCTDAAAEGLNFQFCGALINFDSPWNPMRIEQRIGRVDRLGQRFPDIGVVNLMYDNTVETDVYRALRARIGLFTAVVGKLQPILSSLPSRLTAAVLAPPAHRADARAGLVTQLTRAISDSEQEPFDLDEATRAALEEHPRTGAPYDLADLWRLLGRPELLPPPCAAKVVSLREAWWDRPGGPTLRVTTDPDFFEQHSDSVELWSPGSPAFGAYGREPSAGTAADGITLAELLDRRQ
jgi:SNF2 family DNA or RNA helicase